MYIITGFIVGVITVIIFNALRFKPYAMPKEINDDFLIDEEKVINNMSDMIRCKTISYFDEELINYDEFYRFQELLKERYPKIHEVSTLTKIDKTGLLYKIEGDIHNSASVCMAHYDVVPVKEDSWKRDAFSAEIVDNEMWGRGTLDTKGTLCAIMEATESLLLSGFKPKNDLYLSFAGNEETTGETCRNIVKYLEDNNINIGAVFDEGGAVVEKVFPGVSQSCALIGIAEKGLCNIKLSIQSNGGHASTPPKHTILGELSQAIVNIENKPFKYKLTTPVKQMFDTLGRHSSFAFKILFANLWLFLPILKLVCKLSGGELSAMMKTTCASTKMEGSKAYNVLPPEATAGLNLRIIGGESIESAKSYIEKVIKNENIKVEVVEGSNPSINSKTDCDEYEMLKTVIHNVWPEAIVSPYLMMACSDSRSYCKISDKVYRFSAMALTKEERNMIHAHNERIKIDTLIKIVEFYSKLIKRL